MKRILILGNEDDCADAARLPLREFDGVCLTFWCAPEYLDELIQHGARRCWRLNDFVTDYGALVRRGFEQAQAIAAGMPLYRGINPLTAWENVMANALRVPVFAAAIYDGLRDRASEVQALCFLAQSDIARAFFAINARHADPLTLGYLENASMNGVGRWGHKLGAGLGLLQEALRERNGQRLFWELVEAADPNYGWRRRGAHKQTVTRGHTWFYSSYSNFTRALLRYLSEPDPAPQWLVNSFSGSRALLPGTPSLKLWELDAPHHTKVHAPILAQARDLGARLPPNTDDAVRAALETNAELRDVLTRVLALTLTEIDLMTQFLDKAEPVSIWVGNQWGSEGTLVQLAKQRNVRVTQVQHGVLEHHYAWSSLYTDKFLVWGEYWQVGIAPSEHGKVRVAPGAGGGQTRQVAKQDTLAPRRITFFSAPLKWIEFGNASMALWETVTMLDALARQNYPIIVRIHPADEIAPYMRLWEKMPGSVPPNVTFDRASPLDTVLDKTDVALMIFSTVFLNCVARGIPVVGLGWYDFFWRGRMQDAGLIHYENSIADVMARCRGEMGQGNTVTAEMVNALGT